MTEDPRMTMVWNGDTIVNLSREFLASNGAPKHQVVHVEAQHGLRRRRGRAARLPNACTRMLTDLNVASNKGLSERFDSTIGAGTVLMPFGGKRQLTPNMAMVAKLPVFGETTTASRDGLGLQPVHHGAEPVHGRVPVRGRVAVASWSPPASNMRRRT